jgi:hypothetical protein
MIMAPRSIRPLRKIKLIIATVLILILLGVVFVLTAKPLFNLDLGIQLIKNERTTVSVSVLREVRDIFTFNTVEYVYKTVFPHDFIPASLDWQSLLSKREQNMEISYEERDYLTVYDLCSRFGIRLDRQNYDFVVVTSIITAGYDITDTAYEEITEETNIEEYVRISESGKTLSLKLPEPQIVNFVIEDAASRHYFYPDIEIKPEHWKLLSAYVAGKVKKQVLEEGILHKAGEKGEKFIERIMLDAGFSKVKFIQN